MDLEVHAAVLAAGDAETGCTARLPSGRLEETKTAFDRFFRGAAPPSRKARVGPQVHLVTEDVDAGAVVAQTAIPVAAGATPESLKAAVQALEGPALVEALAKVRDGAAGARFAPRPREAAAAPVPDAAPLTYAAAGVSIDAGNALVDRIKPLAKATARSGTLDHSISTGGSTPRFPRNARPLPTAFRTLPAERAPASHRARNARPLRAWEARPLDAAQL